MAGRNLGGISFTNCRRLRALVGACTTALAATFFLTAAAGALPPPNAPFVYNEPTVRQVGPEVMIFDWSVHQCETWDITDEPARAFRDDTGKIQLMNSHFSNYRWIANSTLDGTYTHPCTKTMSSHENSDPSKYDAKEWLASPWTPDGKTVYALVHMEYRGNDYLTGCPSWPECWFNAITSAVSTNSGATFTHATAPANLVAATPYQFAMNGPNGYFSPSNIVRTGDGYFYVMFRAQPRNLQQIGTCIMRTRDVSDQTSWRAWNGTTFSVRFANPYVGTINPADHVCAPVDFNSIGTISESLTYNTYFRKWMLVGNSVGDPAHGKPPGVYYALSDDLLNWSDVQLLMEAEISFASDCTPPDPIKESSLLDPDSTSRNFETVGQRAQQFYTWYHLSGCNGTADRDFIRIPIEFSNQQPGGPSAQVAAADRTPAVGTAVAFDASGSSDANGSIKKYRWDMDGNGTFERDTGRDPTTDQVFTNPKQVTVTVRVTDDDGKFTDDTAVVKPRGKR